MQHTAKVLRTNLFGPKKKIYLILSCLFNAGMQTKKSTELEKSLL